MSNPADPQPLFHSEAEQEYLDAVAWYAERNPSIAAEFVDAVEQAVMNILESPRRYPETIAGTRSYLLRRFRHRIVYRINAVGAVQIVALAHTSRRPGYWRKRR